LLNEDTSISKILQYYMGKNTQDRQEFIIDNLRIEMDEASEDSDSENKDEKDNIVEKIQAKEAV